MNYLKYFNHTKRDLGRIFFELGMERTVTLRRLVISVVINIFCLRQTQTWKLEIVPIISLKAFSNISPVKYTVNTVILYYLVAILNTTITFI